MRKLDIEHSWTVAWASGILFEAIGLTAGYILLGISAKIVGVIVGSVISGVIAMIIQFLFLIWITPERNASSSRMMITIIM